MSTGKSHIGHLKQVFERCREFGISLNPAKSVFGVTRGKLLGHIICKDGVKIDPERVEGIAKIPLPSTKKGLQSFFGKINFLRKFIPNLAEVTKPLNRLLRNDVKFQWDEQCQKILDVLKEKMVSTPILVFPDWRKEFNVHVNASFVTLGVVLA